MTDVTQKVQRTSIFVDKSRSNGFKVQRTVTFNKQYFGATHLTKRYFVVSTNIEVRCTLE
jgi:hypothetical protein